MTQYWCDYCIDKRKTDPTRKISIKGARYLCKECKEVCFCTSCYKELRKIKEIKIGKTVHKSSHVIVAVKTSLDKISASHLISTYHNDAGNYAFYNEYAEELYGELLEKKNWKNIDLGKVDLEKILNLDGKEFNKQIDNIQERLDDFERYIHRLHLEEIEINDILNPIICEITKKDENFYIARELAKNCKFDESEKNIAYKSIDLHYHNILRRIQYQMEKEEKVIRIADQSEENKKKLDILDEKLTDLRTGLTFKALEAKIKDFEYELLKPNTKLLFDLLEDEYDFSNEEDKNFLTQRGNESKNTYQAVLGIIGYRRAATHSVSLQTLFVKLSSLTSDQKILEDLMIYLTNNESI